MPIIKLEPHGQQLRFRKRIPKDVSEYFAGPFLYFNTKTKDPTAARAECLRWLADVEEQFEQYRRAPSKHLGVIDAHLKGTPAVITRDFNGQPFVFREDGYFNMGKAAQAFGKRLGNFWDSQEVQEYIIAVTEHVQGRKLDFQSSKVVLTASQRGTGINILWGHPKLAVFFARWLDVRFSVWCDTVIRSSVQAFALRTLNGEAVIRIGSYRLKQALERAMLPEH